MSDRSETARVLSEAWDGFTTSMAEASPDAQRRLVGGTFGALAVLTVLAGGVAFWLSGVVGDGRMPGDPWFFEKVRRIMSVELAAWVDVFGSSAILIPIVLTVAIFRGPGGHGRESVRDRPHVPRRQDHDEGGVVGGLQLSGLDTGGAVARRRPLGRERVFRTRGVTRTRAGGPRLARPPAPGRGTRLAHSGRRHAISPGRT